MLKLDKIQLRRGAKLLLDDASLSAHAGEKLGLIGANGCGKSSLFALIRGRLHLDGGELALPPDWVIAHVAQETPALATPALDYVLDGDTELRQVQADLATAESAGEHERAASLHARLDAIDAWSAEARAARLLDGLAFAPETIRQPVAEFSGGWRMRLNLAQALMCRSDLLLLDEPTNHLDLDAVLWLEQWLARYAGSLLLISHDRDFLDAVCQATVHVAGGKLERYRGGYSEFERQRGERLAQQQAAHARQQREIAHMQAFVTRFKAKASKAKQAQSRVKALVRMEQIAPAHVDSPFDFSFRSPPALPNPLLQLDGAAVGYDGQPVLQRLGLSLLPGARLGLLGANGAGKSTLIRLLAGELTALSGRVEIAETLRIGYFAQHQVEQLDDAASPLLHLQRQAPDARELDLRNYLGGFGFTGDAALAPVGPFSGGERARLVLALLVHTRPNLLLLDEPTNHLDLEMRHALTVALQGFDGAIVLVSHDRHLLRTVCDELRWVRDGGLHRFDGDLDDYARALAEQRREPAAATGSGDGNSAAARRQRKRQEAENRKRLQPLTRQVKQLERDMERLQGKLEAVEQRLADTSLYEAENKAELNRVLAEQTELKQGLNAIEADWLEAAEALEEAEAG